MCPRRAEVVLVLGANENQQARALQVLRKGEAMIPGSEHAPTIAVGYVTEQGGFYTSIEDIPKIRRVDTGELIYTAYIEARRQLTVTDPDDQRVIWRLAAHSLGATREITTSARFAWQWTTGIGHRWCLLVGHFHASVIWEGAADVVDTAHATAALCAHLWGPKQLTP